MASAKCAAGVFTFLLTVAGVALSITVWQMVETVNRDIDRQLGYNNQFRLGGGAEWAQGLTFLIPGVLGVLILCCDKKPLYIIAILVGVACLIGIAVFIYLRWVIIYALVLLGNMDCREVYGSCHCRSGPYDRYTDQYLRNCDLIHNVYSFGVGIISLWFVGGFLLFVQVILFGVLSRSESSGGTTLAQPGTSLPMGYVTGHTEAGYSTQPFLPQGYPNQQYPNQPYGKQQYPIQQYPNQQYPPQPYPSQGYPNPGQNYNYPPPGYPEKTQVNPDAPPSYL